MLEFRSGDARAFSTLVKRHRQAVYNFILRSVGHRQRAEDVLQETWLKVVRNSSEYAPKAKFTTWVYTIARNLCVDCARKESYRRVDSLDGAKDEGADERSLGERVADETTVAPDQAAHQKRLQPLLVQAIEALPADQREVFILREYHGIGFREIAQVTQMNENSVKSRMRYALEGLRKRLKELGVDEDVEGRVEGRTVASV